MHCLIQNDAYTCLALSYTRWQPVIVTKTRLSHGNKVARDNNAMSSECVFGKAKVRILKLCLAFME